MPSGKGSKLLRYVEHRLRVTLSDGRTIIGTFLAFDKHLNLVLSEAEEFRTLRKPNDRGASIVEERQEKRTLGLIILRGENVVSVAVEGPPPPSSAGGGNRLTPGGPGMARGAGRGGIPPPGTAAAAAAAVPPVGLGAAPVHGVGGPAPQMMMGGVGVGGLPPPPPPPPGGVPPPPQGMGRGGGGGGVPPPPQQNGPPRY